MGEWSDGPRRPRGELIPLETAVDLARLWYRGLLAPGWRRRTASEARAVFVTLGLTSDFWLG